VYLAIPGPAPRKTLYLHSVLDSNRRQTDYHLTLVGPKLCMSMYYTQTELWYHIPLDKLTFNDDIDLCSKALFRVFDEWDTW
jgi:hypothetical protein